MINISDRTQNYLAMLEDKFNKDKFYEFIKDLLNLENENIINGKELNAGSEQYGHYIDKAQLYAKYEDDKRRNIGVIVIKLKDNKNPANARTLQRNFIAHLLDFYNLDASLTAIYSDTDDTWRLSFVKQEIEIEVGKLKTKVSPAKRYSYLFGKDEPNHTAKEQLLELLENNTKHYSIEEIEDKFSVEKVTKDFFERYKDNYLKLKEVLENNEEFVSEATRCDFTSEEFTKKLMGQIVFIYFLQKKGWLGVKLVPDELSLNEFNELYNKQDVLSKKILDKFYINYDGKKIVKKDVLEKVKVNEQDIEILSDIFVDKKYDAKWGTGEKRFIRTMFTKCKDRNKNFFDDYLEPFFYDGLNHKRKNQYFSVFNCKVPFLNGGLFEPLDNYMWESSNFNIDNEIFSNSDGNGILDFFDRYNFTMNEEEPLEKDVAVDPEMLGKIFENLLDVKDRKSKGAFYTPREIVHYMCQESLANYLVNKVGVDYNEIKEFIQYGEMIRDVDLKEASKTDYLVGKSIFENVQLIDKALENIKVADPSVGSGAFPLGMLNEIVKLRDILTSYMLIYNKLGLFDRKYPEEMIKNKRNIYNIKWNTIKNSIYAVDIENSAVDITKLRLWLSIVVDQVEVPKSGPEPLPNLDCKIMQGNSLVDEYAGIKLIDEKFIDELKDRENVKFNESNGIVKDLKGHRQYISSNQIQFGDGQKKVQIDDLINLKKELYGATEPNRKKELLEKIQTARNELLRLNFAGTNKEKELLEIDKSHNKPYFAWMLEYIEVFIENDGFDIVIGNPPYVSTKGSEEKDKEILSKIYGFADDLYSHFIFKGFNLLHTEGIITMITPDSYFNTITKSNLRALMNSNRFINLVHLGHDIFETAMVSTAVFVIEKNNKKGMCKIIDARGKKKLKDAKEYIENQDIFENSINGAYFVPNEINKKINNKFAKIHKDLINTFWDKIATSAKIEKNKDCLNKYRDNLKENDWTLIGLVTEGGQGLATGNNGKYIGVGINTKNANVIKETRKKKLEEFNKEYKTNYVLPENEEDIWNLFEKIKKQYGNKAFGQGYIYRIISNEYMANIDTLTEDEKENGITGKKTYVRYDKGDKDGYRWFLESPFLIDWSRENVESLKNDSSARFQNSQFYFRNGFCWNNNLNENYIDIKCKLKPKSVPDVASMSLYPLTNKIPDYWIILTINNIISGTLYRKFLNATVNVQMNDIRMLPILVPTKEQLKNGKELFEQAVNVQKDFYNEVIDDELRKEKLEEIQQKIEEFFEKVYML